MTEELEIGEPLRVVCKGHTNKKCKKGCFHSENHKPLMVGKTDCQIPALCCEIGEEIACRKVKGKN